MGRNGPGDAVDAHDGEAASWRKSRIDERAGGTASIAAIAAMRATASTIATGRRQSGGSLEGARIGAARSGVAGKRGRGRADEGRVSTSAIPLPQTLERTGGARLDGAGANVECSGRLGLGQLEEEAAGDHEALRLAQVVDRAGAARPAVVSRASAPSGAGPRPPRPFGCGAQREGGAAPCRAAAIAGLVGHDPKEPGPKGLARRKRPSARNAFTKPAWAASSASLAFPVRRKAVRNAMA